MKFVVDRRWKREAEAQYRLAEELALAGGLSPDEAAECGWTAREEVRLRAEAEVAARETLLIPYNEEKKADDLATGN